MITLIFQYSFLSLKISRANYVTVVLLNYISCVNLMLVSFRNLSPGCHAQLTPRQKKGQLISEHMKGPLVAATRSSLMKAPDITFTKSLNHHHHLLMPYHPFPYVTFLLGFPMIRCEPIDFGFSRV